MRVTCRPDAELTDALLAQPVGALEVHGATHLWEAISSRLDGDRTSLIIDMSRVEWLSSAGIGTLIRLVSRVEDLGGRLAVFGCNDKVSKVLRITALETVLNSSDSAEAARERLRGDAAS